MRCMIRSSFPVGGVVLAAGMLVSACSTVTAVPAATTSSDAIADAWAQKTLEEMTLDERLTLLRGYLPQRMAKSDQPAGVPYGAGYVPGVPRLGVPALVESDASLGVANMGGFMRRNDVATALPSGAAMASTWNPALVEQGGAMIGAEARAKGFNVLLAGGVNLVREPRGGRNFEYLGEDPLLAGTLVGHAIRGVQSNHIVSTIKHYVLNAQETGRTVLSADIGEAALRESDLLAFEIGLEIGEPGSVMCGYNRINGVYACENGFLLNDVLRRDWHYRGWVMSDWGAVHGVSIRAGLDQQSGTQPQEKPYFGSLLTEALDQDRVSEADIDRSVLRILRTMQRLELVDDPVKPGAEIDFDAHGDIAQAIAERGIVLLKNENHLLPVAASTQHILLVGAHADVGVLAGGGSSQVNPVGGAALSLAIPGEPIYHRKFYLPSSPLKALRAQLPHAAIDYDDGMDPVRAAAAAQKADLVVVFAEQFSAEGKDVSSLTLPDKQDALISAVATANPRTVVVLETGGAVLMPWLDKVGAVLAAWYPGQRGGLAIARVMSGEVNPSGRLPITFPASTQQLPNPVLPGSAQGTNTDAGKGLYDLPDGDPGFAVDYPEGSAVGYRWYDREHFNPLFAFGYGLSYTQFKYGQLQLRDGDALSASFTVSNTGERAGTEIAQVYVQVAGTRRMVGWQRIALERGESRRVTVTAEPRVLASFDVEARDWHVDAGSYRVEVSTAVDSPQLSGTARLNDRRIKP